MALEGYRPNRLVKVEEDIDVTAAKTKQAQQGSSSLRNFINAVKTAAEDTESDRRAAWQADPDYYNNKRQQKSNEELRQAYLKRLDDSNHPLTQADIALLEQIQNQQYQQQYLKHLKRMEEMKKQEMQQQQMDRQMDNLNRPTHLRPDGRGGYIVD
jgi:lipopolysaccharide export LptBFGC system permease protein LptF